VEVFSVRWTISWIFFAGDVSHVETDVLRFREGMDVLEYVVGGFVPASAFPPTLDDSSVVPENLGVSASGCGWCEREDEEPASDCFCPPDVPAIGFPPW